MINDDVYVFKFLVTFILCKRWNAFIVMCEIV